ncbi:MAG: SGNH/GDSL hydrolase family protein [Candidatus Delongbacteria bacterium]|nr:SGNH/GDSL hydrolase family protein [Candidatus Delongbacteria bacterium]
MVSRWLKWIGWIVVLGGLNNVMAKGEAQPGTLTPYRWIMADTLPREGQGWTETAAPYDRLPSKAKSQVRDELWTLSQHSAGMVIPFISNSRTIVVRWKLRFNFKLTHMTGSGIRGLDLYAFDSLTNQWRYVGTGRPDSLVNQKTVGRNMTPADRRFQLYLPLYDGIDSLAIGIDSGAYLRPDRNQDQLPLVFYGTSITQGCSASRPGMAYPAIIGRWLNRKTINLGFSGNGRMDMALADLIGELPSEMIILDCLPNLTLEQITTNVQPFIIRLRQLQPETPILLVENVLFPPMWSDTSLHYAITHKNNLLKQEYQELLEKGYRNIHYVEAENLIGQDGETAVDGTHLTDIGMQRIAEQLADRITSILKTRRHPDED